LSRRRIALVAASVLAIPVAIGLLVLAVDVLRVPSELSARDTRFESAPQRQAGLWRGIDFLPQVPASRLLGIHDDLEYRRATGLYVRAKPGELDYQGKPALESLRARAQYEVTRWSQEDPDPKRRAQMLVMYGVITLDNRPYSDEERQKQIGSAADAFRAALALDPGNEDAKRNLEMVLSVHGPVALPGNAPSGGQDQGNVSGQGRTGGGY
jgi:hypothetical protein